MSFKDERRATGKQRKIKRLEERVNSLSARNQNCGGSKLLEKTIKQVERQIRRLAK